METTVGEHGYTSDSRDQGVNHLSEEQGAWPHPGGVGSDNVGAGPEGCGSREDGGCL
jgi:hypothetical protein